MKKALSVITSVILCIGMIASLCPTLVFAESAPDYTLKFKNGKFKILVLADCQDDNSPDQRMITMIGKALDYEKPDIVVFLGDNIVTTTQTAFKTGLKKLMAPLVARNIPYAYVYGNHDDQSALISKSFMHTEYKKVGTCLTYDADPDLTGLGNCNLPVMSSNGNDIAFNLWMIDSNTYTDSSKDYYDNVHQDQLNWYVNTSTALERQAGHKVNSLVFQHIIVPEAYNLLVEDPNGGKTYNGKTYALQLNGYASGYLGEYPCPPRDNSGELDTMANRGDVLGIVTGHDHKNSFVGRWNGVDLIQTAGMTYESYGSDEIRGYRTITIDESDTSRYETATVTYTGEAAGVLNPVATGNGIPDEYYYPEGTNFISDVAIGYGSSKKEPALNALTSSGFTPIEKDLNGGAGGAYIYMGYKLTNNYTESIKALRFSVLGESGYANESVSVINNNNVTFKLVSEGADGIVDLNKNASGAYIYAYYTKDPLAGSAVTSISFDSSIAKPASGETATILSNVNCAAELNAGTGGTLIYCHYSSAMTKVDSSALRRAYSTTANVTASDCTAASYNNLQTARSAGKVIIDKLDAEHASTYSQTAINSAAAAINSAYANLEHTVTYKNYNGSVITTENVLHGRAAVYSGIPTRASSEQYDYVFSGWSQSLASVTTNMTVTANYNSILRSYSVIFKNYDGEVLQEGEWAYGATPAYSQSEPVKPSTDSQVYAFAGWDQEIASVRGEQTYTAVFTASPRKYTVTFKNYNGEVLQESEWAYGVTPVYSQELPAKPEDDYAVYTFSGWDQEPCEVTGEAVYTAQFSTEYKSYTYKFFVDGTEIPEFEITKTCGEAVTAPVYTPAEGCDFSGWSPEVPEIMGTEDIEFYGTTSPRSATVMFDLNGGTGTVPAAITAAFGTGIVLPAQGDITRSGFDFKGWAAEANAREPVSEFIIPLNGATLYAVWTAASVVEPELIVPEESDIYANEENLHICGIAEGTTARALEAELTVNGGYAEVESVGRYVGTGTQINIYDNDGNLFKSYTVIIFGDIDGNGRVTAADVSAAVQGFADGFDDSLYELAANVIRMSKRDKFNMSDITALMYAVAEEPIDQAELAFAYENFG